MKQLYITFFGLAALVFTLSLNFKNTMNDYGVVDNKLHLSVLAQTNTSGGGSTSGDGSCTCSNCTCGDNSSGGGSSNLERTKHCRKVGCSDTWRGTSDLRGCIPFFKKQICNFKASIEVSYPYFGEKENCTGGSEWFDCDACQDDCVPTGE